MLSILVVNWNTRDLLDRCLASLQSHPPASPFEVIVVDNNSSDGSAAMVASEHDWVRLIASETNLGYAEGNNRAFENASGEYLLTLNPDTQIGPGALDTCLEVMADNPSYGVLGCKLVGTDGRTQRSVRGFPTFWGMFAMFVGLDRLNPSYSLPNFDYEKEQPAPQPMGTFLLFRREALELVGDPKRPFDPQFPIFFNEVDLLKRLLDAGWPCLYTPRVSILHHGGESTKQVRKSMIWESHRSAVRYFRKHRGWIVAICFALLAYPAAFIRARGYYRGFRG